MVRSRAWAGSLVLVAWSACSGAFGYAPRAAAPARLSLLSRSRVRSTAEPQAVAAPLSPPSEGTQLPRTVLSYPPDELAKLLGASRLAARPEESTKAELVWNTLRQGYDLYDANETSSLTRRAQAGYSTPRVARMLDELGVARVDSIARVVSTTYDAASGTRKMLVELRADGALVECVLLRMKKRSSLCVSSQVGCKQGCVFCATGRMGEVRSLSADEILAQVWLGRRAARALELPPLANLVFMGMGEPLNNLPNVRRALELLTARDAFGFSQRSVIVSTVAPSVGAVAEMAKLPAMLAWSLHAADDATRRALVPTSRAHSVVELRDAFVGALAAREPARRKVLMVEITLIRGVNDGVDAARRVVELLAPFGRGEVLVNLIPMNPVEHAPEWRGAGLEAARAFQRAVWDGGWLCTIRGTKGDDEAAACGQLSTKATMMRDVAREYNVL